MKLKVLMISGILLSAVALTTAMANSDINKPKVVHAEVDLTQAEKYNFLKETRDAANEQGLEILKQLNTQVLESEESSDEEIASASYISMLLEKAENDESARDELLNVLSGAPAQEAEVEEVAGIPFANQQAADTTRKELVTAINVLTSSIANASLSIEKNTTELHTSSADEDAVNVGAETDESLIDATVISPDDAQSIDLAEIALIQATQPNVMDGLGNCKSTTRSYMRYTAVTSKTSPQYALLYGERAYTDPETGFRMVDGRYCIAVGSAYTQKIGTKIDLVMVDGTIIRCILGDCKADRDTDAETHSYCTGDGSVAEFIVDYEYFNRNTKRNPVNTALGVYCAIEKVVIIN